MTEKIFVCSSCDKNTRDNPIEMWVYCHKHFKDFIKREQLETSEQFEENVCKPTRVYLKHLIKRFPETEERVNLILSRMKEEQEKLSLELQEIEK